MKPQNGLLFVAVAITTGLLEWAANAQIYDTNNVVVQTFAGSGFTGWVDGQGTRTMFNYPTAIVADSSSNLFVWDWDNERVRKITPDATVTTFAGGGTGQLPGYGTNVPVSSLNGVMVIDNSNVLWIVESDYLLRIGNDAYVSRVSPTLSGPLSLTGVCFDSANNLYCSDASYNRIYRYQTNGTWEVFVGSGNTGAVDGNGIFCSFSSPSALVADAANNIYVWDSGNFLIRKINQNRDVVTIAGHQGVNTDSDGIGRNATFYNVYSMVADNLGNIYLACLSSIRRMDARTNVTTVAGSFTQSSYTNGVGSLARFNAARGLCLSQGMIFVADAANQRIRQISFNPSTEPVLPANLQLSTYPGLQIIGTVGRTYQIQTSPDMNTWTERATLLLTSSPYLWIDQNPVGSNRFYRAFLLP